MEFFGFRPFVARYGPGQVFTSNVMVCTEDLRQGVMKRPLLSLFSRGGWLRAPGSYAFIIPGISEGQGWGWDRLGGSGGLSIARRMTLTHQSGPSSPQHLAPRTSSQTTLARHHLTITHKNTHKLSVFYLLAHCIFVSGTRHRTYAGASLSL